MSLCGLRVVEIHCIHVRVFAMHIICTCIHTFNIRVYMRTEFVCLRALRARARACPTVRCGEHVRRARQTRPRDYHRKTKDTRSVWSFRRSLSEQPTATRPQTDKDVSVRRGTDGCEETGTLVARIDFLQKQRHERARARIHNDGLCVSQPTPTPVVIVKFYYYMHVVLCGIRDERVRVVLWFPLTLALFLSPSVI